MGKKILIVEDEMIIAEDINITLQKFNYEVINIVPTGKRALETIEKTPPDLVLMDIKLRGDIDGIKTAQLINEKYDIPIVYLTANADLATYEEAKLTSPFGYLIKPFKERELHATIEMAFYKTEAERKIKNSRKRIIMLHKVAIKISAADTKKKIMKIVFETVSDVLESDYIAFVTFDKDDKVEHIEENRNAISAKNAFYEELIKKIEVDNHFIIENDNDFTQKYSVYYKLDKKIIFVYTTNSTDEDLDEEIQLIALLLGHVKESFKRVELENKLRQMAIIDGLTGCYNRHYLNHIIEREIKQSKRYKNDIAIMMVDVNDLKPVNDNFGHNIGDFVIRKVADIILLSIRESDIAIRYGGDEFLIIMPRTGENVEILQNRLEENIKNWNLHNSNLPFPLSIAIGYDYWHPDEGKSIEEVIEAADKKMYENKRKMKMQRKNVKLNKQK